MIPPRRPTCRQGTHRDHDSISVRARVAGAERCDQRQLRDQRQFDFAFSVKFARETKRLGLRPPARKRGRPPQRRDRHLQIAGAVAMLVEDYGLEPTRSHASAAAPRPLSLLHRHCRARTEGRVYGRLSGRVSGRVSERANGRRHLEPISPIASDISPRCYGLRQNPSRPRRGPSKASDSADRPE